MAKQAKSHAEEAQQATAKFSRDGLFAGIISELNLNQDQLAKRQGLIKRIEKALSEKYGAENKLISYVIRFGHRNAQNSFC